MEGCSSRWFTEDYKRQCAELAVSSGRSITWIAKELGLRDSALQRWVEFELQPTSAARRPTTRATPMSADQTVSTFSGDGGPGRSHTNIDCQVQSISYPLWIYRMSRMIPTNLLGKWCFASL